MKEMMGTGEMNHHVKDLSNIEGHLVPGTVLTIFGVLWLRHTLLKFHIARREAMLKGKSLSKLNYRNFFFSKYHSGCCAQLPVEAICGVTFGVFGTIAEFIASFREGRFQFNLAQHVVMYAIYILLGVCGILLHKKAAIPHNIDYAAFIMANSVQGLLFLGHIVGRTHMNVQMHQLLVKVIGVTVLCTALEMIFKRSVLAAVGRSLGLIFEGVWLSTIGFILYPPSFLMEKWDQDDHENLHKVGSVFTILIILICVMALITNFAIHKAVNRMSLSTIERIQTVMYSEYQPNPSKSDTEKPLISDSDYEI